MYNINCLSCYPPYLPFLSILGMTLKSLDEYAVDIVRTCQKEEDDIFWQNLSLTCLDYNTSNLKFYDIKPKDDNINDIMLTNIIDEEKHGPFQFFATISNITCRITKSNINCSLLLKNSMLILEDSQIYFNNAYSRQMIIESEVFTSYIIFGEQSKVIIKNCYFQIVPGSKPPFTFVMDSSNLILESSQIRCYNNYFLNSKIETDNVKIQVCNNKSENVNDDNDQKQLKYLFRLNKSQILLKNSVFDGEGKIKNCLKLMGEKCSINTNNSDFYDFNVVIKCMNESKIILNGSHFFNNNSNIKMKHSTASVCDCIFEDTKEKHHILLDQCSNMLLSCSVFTQSVREQIFSTNSSELTIQKCSFLNTQNEHIFSGFDTKLEVFNSYFTDALKSSAIQLQDVMESKIIATTIENCKYGVIVCDLSRFSITSSVIRNILHTGLLISTGSKVECDACYFFSAKIVIQNCSTLIANNSCFSKDIQNDKNIDTIMEETYILKLKLNDASNIPKLIRTMCSPCIIIETAYPMNFHNCIFGNDFKFHYRSHTTELPYLEYINAHNSTSSNQSTELNKLIEKHKKPKKCMSCNSECSSLYLNSCGHYTFCENCQKTHTECPICKRTINSVHNENFDISLCPICREPPPSKLGVVSLYPCQHTICNKCVLNHLAQSNLKCPYCRHKIIELHHIVPYEQFLH